MTKRLSWWSGSRKQIRALAPIPALKDASDALHEMEQNLDRVYAEGYMGSGPWGSPHPYPASKKKRKYALPELEVISSRVMQSGTYYALNVWVPGLNTSRAITTVKARAGKGAPYVCLTCCTSAPLEANRCLHIKCVQAYIEAHPEVTT